jgi:hypothetical protein
MSYEYAYPRQLIILGVILTVVGLLGLSYYEELGYLSLFGVLAVILGFLLKREWVELTVVGMVEPQKFHGTRKSLDDLLQLVRTKKAGA